MPGRSFYVESYGVWDVIYRYLLPDWWIIPVYTTVTAWIATVAWWRRAVRLGRDWARRLLLAIDNAPTARRLAMLGTLAVPFFLVPLIAISWWYVLGGALWSILYGPFHSGGGTDLGVNYVNLAVTIYAGVAVGFTARTTDDEYERWETAFWFSLIVSGPLVLVGACGLLVGLLSALTHATLGGTPANWDLVWVGLALVVGALLGVAALWAAGWATRKGIELLAGAERPAR